MLMMADLASDMDSSTSTALLSTSTIFFPALFRGFPQVTRYAGGTSPSSSGFQGPCIRGVANPAFDPFAAGDVTPA